MIDDGCREDEKKAGGKDQPAGLKWSPGAWRFRPRRVRGIFSVGTSAVLPVYGTCTQYPVPSTQYDEVLW